jgi:endoglucanase
MRRARFVVTYHTFLALVICSALAFFSAAKGESPPSKDAFARGINLSGAELNYTGRRPDRHGTDYVYPPAQELDYYAGKEFSVVRLPYRWERLQHSLFGELDQAELGRIDSFIAAARARGMRVIPEPHNFGRYVLDDREILIGTGGVSIEAFADFCRRMAGAFADNDGVYGQSLMNEPHDSRGLWKRTAQAGLSAIRGVDSKRLVLAPGDQWSGAWSWSQYNDDFLLEDPSNNLVYEAHQYFDRNGSGTYRETYDASGAYPDLGVTGLHPFASWLRKYHAKGILTEFGVPNDDPRWLELTRRLLAYLASERIPWTYWAGGPWWGNYPLSAEPKNGVDAPIMAVLTKDYTR